MMVLKFCVGRFICLWTYASVFGQKGDLLMKWAFITEEVGLVGEYSEFDEALCAGTKAPMANFGAMECTMEWHHNSSWYDILASKVCQPLFNICLLINESEIGSGFEQEKV